MILFVTSSDLPFFPGRGGTEAFTISHIRELRRWGVDARILTVGLQVKDGRKLLPDIPFLDVTSERDLTALDATLVNVCMPHIVPTMHPSYIMAHVPPASSAYPLSRYKNAAKIHKLIANSHFTCTEWAKELQLNQEEIPIVHPFADPAFALVIRPPKPPEVTRVLFAGRLTTSKGIYVFLEALHHDALKQGYHFTVTTAGAQSTQGAIIEKLLRHHPRITLVEACTTPETMAQLMATQDIVVMPSNHQHWNEAFGMISVEAQHAGCLVVASDAGGLPETDCGGLLLFEPGNSYALAQAIQKAAKMGTPTTAQRDRATKKFTLAHSVDSLLAVIAADKHTSAHTRLKDSHS